jgi:hypothetical protein
MSRLIDAIKRKFKSPQEAIKALGLDEKLLEAESIVGDSKENLNMKNKLTRKAGLALLTTAAILRPKLAQDAKVNLTEIFKGAEGKTFAEKVPNIIKGLEAATKGKLAKDESLGEVAHFLDMIRGAEEGKQDDVEDEPLPEDDAGAAEQIGENFAEPDTMDAEPMAQVESFLKGKLSDEDLEKCMGMLRGGEGGTVDEDPKLKELGAADEDKEEEKSNAKTDTKKDLEKDPLTKDKAAKDTAKDEPLQFKGKPKVGGGMDEEVKDMVTKPAMDEALKKVAEDTRRAVLATQHEIRAAEKRVRPWVGELSGAFDSADQVMAAALKSLGVKGIDKIHPSAYPHILDAQPLPGARKQGEPRVAMDEAATESFASRFPNAARIQA